MARKSKPTKPARRKRGTGTITDLTTGGFIARYPKARTGHYVRRCATRAEAEEWLAGFVTRADSKLDIAGGQLTLAAWLERWLTRITTDLDKPLKAKTIDDYQFKCDYLVGLLGDYRLTELTHDQIDTALLTMRKVLAQTTVNQIRNLLKRALDDAEDRGYILRNPMPKAPKRQKPQRVRPTIRLTLAQTHALLAAVNDRPERLAWWLCLTLGLREGEVLGLRRVDLDLTACTITIAQQNTQLKGRAHQDTPKTDASRRTLPIPRALAPQFALMLDALTRRAAKALKRGTWQEHGLLFPGKSGRYMNPSSFLHMLKRISAAAKLPPALTVHHLRHTAAQLYTDLGAPDVVRGAIAGHTPQTVTDAYGAPSLETLRPWVEQVYAGLAKTGGKIGELGA